MPSLTIPNDSIDDEFVTEKIRSYYPSCKYTWFWTTAKVPLFASSRRNTKEHGSGTMERGECYEFVLQRRSWTRRKRRDDSHGHFETLPTSAGKFHAEWSRHKLWKHVGRGRRKIAKGFYILVHQIFEEKSRYFSTLLFVASVKVNFLILFQVKRRLSDSKVVGENSKWVELSVRPATKAWVKGKNLGLAVLVEDQDGTLLKADKYFKGASCTVGTCECDQTLLILNFLSMT